MFPKFMLELLGLYFRLYIFNGAGKIANIICQIILISTTFQLTITNLAGNGRGVNLQGAEEDKGELSHVRRNGGRILP